MSAKLPHLHREFEQDIQNIDEATILLPNNNFSVGAVIPLNDSISGDRFDFREALFLLKKAAPALLAFLLQYLLQVASVFTLGRLGSIELAALTLGSMYASITCWSIGYGTATALDTLCPQGYTSGNPKMVGVYTQRSILIMMMEFIPIGIMWWVAEDILISLGQEEELSKLAALYLRYLLWVASSNRVGNLLGAGLPNRAKIATNVAFIIAVIGAACNAISLLFFKDSWGYLFSNDEEVVKLVAKILPLAALFQLSDGVGAIGSGVLRGQGRQKIVAMIYLSAYYLIAFPLGIALTFVFNLGLEGLWWSVTCASLNMGIGIFAAVSMTDWNLEVENCLKRVGLRDEVVNVG
ncbi:3595_t:CDS:2 [Acaulospora colombiana]|uniref:3595_t:CDS:1 n=1 Tax=Acaulospora colombiana TaxID=27376 RepID=A0ACA9MBD0_9GLOM|nr:3595_t:CDS:2 [Acaulospora colombiana]